MPEMPIKLSNGTSIGPVAIICATVAFLGCLAGFIILLMYAPKAADAYIRPLLPTLAAIGAGVALWVRVQASDRTVTAQNQAIYEQASEAAETAEAATRTVTQRLDGELSVRIEQAIEQALARYAAGDAGGAELARLEGGETLERPPVPGVQAAVGFRPAPPAPRAARRSFREAVDHRRAVMAEPAPRPRKGF